MLSKLFNHIKSEIEQNKKIFFVALFAFLFLLISGLGVLIKVHPKDPIKEDQKILGIKVENPTSTPTPTDEPTPTPIPTTVRRVTVPTSTPTPTPTSAPSSSTSQSSSPTATPTPTPAPTSSSPTNTPTPTPTPTDTPTPTPIPDQVTIKAGAESWTANLVVGQTAFDVLKKTISGLTYDTYDCCGAFITGFHGTAAVYPQWWEFFINGTSSSVGVSSYIPVNGDVLEFVYHE